MPAVAQAASCPTKRSRSWGDTFTSSITRRRASSTERKSITQKYHVTSRELDVLELVLAGVGNKAIAHELTLGLSTVKSHLQHIYRKTGVAGRAELISRIVADLHTRD